MPPTLYDMYEAAEVFCERYVVDDDGGGACTVDEAALASFFYDVRGTESPTLMYALGRWRRYIAAGELRHVVYNMRPAPRATLAVAEALACSGRTRVRARRATSRTRRVMNYYLMDALARLPTLRRALTFEPALQYVLRSRPRRAPLPDVRAAARDAPHRAGTYASLIIPAGLPSLLPGSNYVDEDTTDEDESE